MLQTQKQITAGHEVAICQAGRVHTVCTASMYSLAYGKYKAVPDRLVFNKGKTL